MLWPTVKRSLLPALILTCIIAAHGAQKARIGSPEHIAELQLKRLGPGHQAKIDKQRRIIYISALDARHLQETMDLLSAYTDAQRQTLLTRPLTRYVTVILPTVDEYRRLARNKRALGFYQPVTRTLTSVDRGRALIHEFTHALHHADQWASRQRHPPWVCEGLATLYESAEVTASGLRPKLDERLWDLQRAIRGKSNLPLDKLLSLQLVAFMKNARLTYAQARYLMFYLHEQKALAKWYAEYKKGYATDKTGAKALESVLSRPLSSIERDWIKWVTELRPKPIAFRAMQGRLGIRIADERGGPRVASLVPSGAAEKAGKIKKGDIIRKFNGRPVNNAAQLAAAIRMAGATRTVTIQLVRGNTRLTIHQPLGAPKLP